MCYETDKTVAPRVLCYGTACSVLSFPVLLCSALLCSALLCSDMVRYGMEWNGMAVSIYWLFLARVLRGCT